VRNRAGLAALLFVSTAFLFFSVYALAISFVLKEGEGDARADASSRKTGNKRPPEIVPQEEMIYFGSPKGTVSLPNAFDLSMRQIALASAENSEAFSQPHEVTIEEINALLDAPERCIALPGFTLLGTALAIPESESLITVASSKSGTGEKGGAPLIMVMRIDDSTDDGALLAAVRRNLVAFKTSAGIRCLGENVGKSASLAEAEKPSNKTGEAAGDQFNVQQTGPNSYRISRDDLNRATANLNNLASEARIVPDKKESGFKIFSIRPGSIWQKIGVQNGDVVKSINGIDLSSPDKALEAYSRLRNANKLSMDVVRRGKKETLEYTVD